MEGREHVRSVMEDVEKFVSASHEGQTFRSIAFQKKAFLNLSEFVADMGHADVNTAQRMAREIHAGLERL